MAIPHTKNLDIMLHFFAIHERGAEDYLKDMYSYYYNLKKAKPHGDRGDPPFEKYWTAVYKKLKEDGYFFEEKNYAGMAIIWTVEGSIRYNAWNFCIYKHRPYAYRKFVEKVNVCWKVAVTVASILNAAAILYLGYKTVWPE